jgi:malonyl-CoA decarboxylase
MSATSDSNRVADPVANFHLSNGASIERINWMADASPRGHDRSFGLMANYLYEDERIAERAEDYVAKGAVSMSSAVKDLIAS